MKIKHMFLSAVMISAVAQTACTTVAEPEPPVVSTYFEDEAKAVRDDIFIGGQPDPADIATLKDRGIAHVVNFRTPEEMEKLDFVEADLLAASGISYTPIPIGGDKYPYTPDSVAQLSAFMKDRKGSVLLHCGSGYRASVVTVAWLMEEENMPLSEALTHAQGWWPLRLEQVTGKSYTLVED